jgi:hypothetical protein
MDSQDYQSMAGWSPAFFVSLSAQSLYFFPLSYFCHGQTIAKITLGWR